MPKLSLPRPASRALTPLWLTLFVSTLTLTPFAKAAGQSSGAPSPGASVLLRLRTGVYDPLRTTAISAANRMAAPDSSGLYLVQFQGPIRAEWRRALEETGAAVIDYIPDFAYLVQVSAATAARFDALPGHRWHGPFAAIARVAALDRLTGALAAVTSRNSSRAPVLLDVMTLPGEDVRAVAKRMPGTVVQRFARRRGFLRVSVSPDAVAKVARVPGVAWVEPYVPPTLFNDVAGGIMRVPTAREELGLYGRGQVVAVADTGLDTGTLGGVSLDFRGRVRRTYALNRTSTGDWSDLNGHGTHVCGSILGAGVLSGADPVNHFYEGSFAGMAPEAGLVMQSIGAAGGSLTIPADMGQLFLPPYQNDGARIHSDSWGGSDAGQNGQYLLSSWQLDDLCWQARDLVILFAAGNGGVDADGDGVVDLNSLSPQAAAKNVITVGASESVRDMPVTWGHFPVFPSDPLWGSRLGDNPNGMAAFSSRGPTADGRIKPDLVAPGTWILSDRSHAPGGGTLWGAFNGDYAYSGGTSMSAPLAAGAAAVVREGLQERFGIANPSSALVKAALLNGADDLAPGQYGVGATREIPPRPNAVEGWGRLNVRQALASGGSRTMLPIDETTGVQTEERRKYSVTVLPGDGPLRVTVVWTDPASSMLAGPELVNDLDLKLLTPDGHWLFGNGGTDRLNNVEAIEVPQPAPGVYTVVVDGYNVPQGPQPFALAISGPIQPPPATGISAWLHVTGTNLPLAGVDLTVTGARSMTLTANGAGRIEARLPAGSYTLTAAKPGWTFDPPVRTVTLTDGQVLPVEFTATAPTGTLTGQVTGRNGQPLGGVSLVLSPGGVSTMTALDGSFRFSSLPPLLYMVTPAQQDTAFSPDSRRVRIPAGSTARADFTVAAGAITGTVITAGPVERQAVESPHPAKTVGTQSWTVSRPGAHWIRVHFTRIDVQPTAEKLEVVDASGQTVNHWSGSFTDLWSAWAAGSAVTMRYTTAGVFARFGFAIDAVQTDLGGGPVSAAPIMLQPGGRGTQTDASGAFRFTGLTGTGYSVAPALSGWQFYPPVTAVTLPSSGTAGTVSFLAQGPPTLSGQVLAAGTTQTVRYESLHPYANHTSRSQQIAVSGATRLRLHFQRLETEFGADFARILGPDGTELKRFSGTHHDFWTDWFAASPVTVRLDSDETLNDWGYLIDAVASDAGAGGPVAGATVTLTPGGASVMTGAEGSYQFTGLTPGSYTLTASAPGYLFTPATLGAAVPAWGLSGEEFDATRAAPSASPGVVAALSPAGRPEVESFAAGAWSSLPDPGSSQLDRLLALQGVNGTPELIAVSEGHLLQNRLIGGAWIGWQTLPGPGTDRAPVAVAELDGTLDVLAVGPDGTVRHYRYLNGAWQAPAIALSIPAWDEDHAALAARDDGTLELVTVGSDQLPRHSRFLNGAWSAPQTIGSVTTALRPALAVGTDGPAPQATLEMALVGEDGLVYHQRFRSGTWESPRMLRTGTGPLVATGPPGLAAAPEARLELVAPAADGLYHGRMKDGSWSDAFRLAPIIAQAVALAVLPQADPPAMLELFATGIDGTLSHLRFNNGQWSAPAPLFGLLAVGPAAPAAR